VRSLYLLLAIVGLLLPYSQFIPFLIDNGADVGLFFEQLFDNRIISFFAYDLFISGLVVILYTVSESIRLKIRHLWLPIAGTVLVGVSFGLPLFLYMRELNLTSQQTDTTVPKDNGRGEQLPPAVDENL